MNLPIRSLFLKIFLWFWLAMIIANVALFAAVAITRPTPTGRSWRDLTNITPNAQRAAEIYDTEGSGALAAFLQERDRRAGINVVFYDVHGNELSGRVPPPGATELVAKAAQAEPPGRLAEVPMPKPKVLNSEIPTGFRTSSLEEAVRVLDGTVLLIDGMTPQMVLVGPGAAFAGGNPNQEVVRVVYDDPPGRQLWLDQQRIEQGVEGAAQARAGGSKLNLLPGDTLVTPGADGASSLNWVSQTMFRLGLRGFLPADSLRALARRVR